MVKCYPVSLNLEGRTCLVVGGGLIAERKVGSLLECKARVLVVSPELTAKLQQLFNRGSIIYRQGKFEPSDLEGAFLVISATNNDKVNKQVASLCFSRNLLVNVVDDPPQGNFFVPAVVRRGPLQIAISTDGKSPLLSRKIREELEQRYGPEYGLLVETLGQIREEVISEIADSRQRRTILAGLVDDEVLNLLRQKQFDRAKERVRNAYSNSRSKP